MFRKKRGTASRESSSPHRWAELAGAAFIVDRHGTVLAFDDRMERLTGWPAVDIVGRHKDLTGSGLEPGAPGSLYDGNLDVPAVAQNVELRLRRRDASLLDVEAGVARLPGRGDRVSVTIHRVLSVSGETIEGRGLDGRDPLTGLIDGGAFVRHLGDAFRAAVEQGRPLALLLADVDHLRRINDRGGRTAGDEVLRRLAGILRATTNIDGGIARVGEDDFAILLPDTGRGGARQTAARLRFTVERFRFFGGAGTDDLPRVTLSIGGASYPADADSGSDLMKRAREALDEARTLGRNRVWCYTRRRRVPLEVPVYFDSTEAILAGFSHDVSPSGLFVHTSQPVEIGMRCALAFPLPDHEGKVHVVGRVVRTVLESEPSGTRVPGMGIEFERFGREERRAIEAYLHRHGPAPRATGRSLMNSPG